VKRAARGSKGRAIEIEGVRLSSPDRVVYPDQGITKRQLAEYWVAVADHALPHMKDRALTLVRCPEGADKDCFYQKHANDGVPDSVPRIEVPEKDGTGLYASVRSVRDILGLVQLGVLEFHVSGARADRLDRPDRLVLDLDPDADLPWKDVADAAVQLRALLGEIGLEGFVKTTGGKGLHIVLPIERRTPWDDALAFTRSVAEALARAEPKRFTAIMSKSRRKGRIYIDFLRNAPNATAVAAYSTRARAAAPVSVPLAWDELSRKARPVHAIGDVPARLASLKADPWEGFDSVRQSITKAMLALF
jgi:bifunctional non-homologous end joining protein LigD